MIVYVHSVIEIQYTLSAPCNSIQLRKFKIQASDKSGKQVHHTTSQHQSDRIFYVLFEFIKNILYPSNKIQCDYCKRDISKTTKILCNEGDFCPGCFATIDNIPKFYHVINKIDYPLYEIDWNGDQQLLLFEGLEKHGFGNWGEIADFIGTNKTREDVEEHYHNIYLSSPGYVPSNNILTKRDSQGRLITVQSRQSGNKKIGRPSNRVTKSIPPSARASITVQQTAKNGSNPAEIVGWMPKRGDFQVEYDNDAQLLLAEMEFHDEDTQQQKNMKFKLIDIYNNKLNQRIKRKQFVVSRGLLDLKEQIRLDKTRTKQQKQTYNMLKVFSRFNSAEDHEKLVQAVIKERQIRQKIEQLKQFKKRGFNTIAEIEEELDGKKKRQQKIKKKQLQAFGNDKNSKTRRMRKDPGPQKSQNRLFLFSKGQQDLCIRIGLPLHHYSLIKQTLIRESVRIGCISKAYASKLFKLDMGLINQVIDYLDRQGEIMVQQSD